MPQRHWAAVAEAPRAAVSSEAGALRIRTVLLLFGLVLGVGLVAGAGGLFITRPPELLTAPAAPVSAGDPGVRPAPAGSGDGGDPARAVNPLGPRPRGKERPGGAG